MSPGFWLWYAPTRSRGGVHVGVVRESAPGRPQRGPSGGGPFLDRRTVEQSGLVGGQDADPPADRVPDR